jgi:hypothetical protein
MKSFLRALRDLICFIIQQMLSAVCSLYSMKRNPTNPAYYYAQLKPLHSHENRLSQNLAHCAQFFLIFSLPGKTFDGLSFRAA